MQRIEKFLMWEVSPAIALKEETIAINRDWVHNQACRLLYDSHVESHFL